jgi:hypothetical protein
MKLLSALFSVCFLLVGCSASFGGFGWLVPVITTAGGLIFLYRAVKLKRGIEMFYALALVISTAVIIYLMSLDK